MSDVIWYRYGRKNMKKGRERVEKAKGKRRKRKQRKNIR
jgi:hypothetical protein